MDTPLTAGTIAYHLRTGAHGCRLYDWQQYLPFICRSFGLDQPAEEQAGLPFVGNESSQAGNEEQA